MQGIPDWAPDVAASILEVVLKKDPFTFHHCCRVGFASRQMALLLGLPEYEAAIYEYSGLFHDIGKVGVPEQVLLKPGRLTEEEHNVMKSHAEMSIEIIKPMTRHEFFRHLVPGIRFHHERFDGQGYPFQLKGERIPLVARAIAVVDAVDAMLNTRPYRVAQTVDFVLKELSENSGTQFDPQMVALYLSNFSKGTIGHDLSLNAGVVIPRVAKISKAA
jgi:putative nucleotidyltransferase with HDIG domain